MSNCMYSLNISPRYLFRGSDLPFCSWTADLSSERKSRPCASGWHGILLYRLSLWIAVTIPSCVRRSLHHFPGASCSGPVGCRVRIVPYLRTVSSLCLWPSVGGARSGFVGVGLTPGTLGMVRGRLLPPLGWVAAVGCLPGPPIESGGSVGGPPRAFGSRPCFPVQGGGLLEPRVLSLSCVKEAS